MTSTVVMVIRNMRLTIFFALSLIFIHWYRVSYLEQRTGPFRLLNYTGYNTSSGEDILQRNRIPANYGFYSPGWTAHVFMPVITSFLHPAERPMVSYRELLHLPAGEWR